MASRGPVCAILAVDGQRATPLSGPVRVPSLCGDPAGTRDAASRRVEPTPTGPSVPRLRANRCGNLDDFRPRPTGLDDCTRAARGSGP